MFGKYEDMVTEDQSFKFGYNSKTILTMPNIASAQWVTEGTASCVIFHFD